MGRHKSTYRHAKRAGQALSTNESIPPKPRSSPDGSCHHFHQDKRGHRDLPSTQPELLRRNHSLAERTHSLKFLPSKICTLTLVSHVLFPRLQQPTTSAARAKTISDSHDKACPNGSLREDHFLSTSQPGDSSTAQPRRGNAIPVFQFNGRLLL
jgi:hypothetical protein